MLVLSRKPGQTIQIGSNVTLTVLGVSGNTVRLGWEAPQEIPIRRGELQVRIERENSHAAIPTSPAPHSNLQTEIPGLLLDIPAMDTQSP